jgi:hypothetical protein
MRFEEGGIRLRRESRQPKTNNQSDEQTNKPGEQCERVSRRQDEG